MDPLRQRIDLLCEQVNQSCNPTKRDLPDNWLGKLLLQLYSEDRTLPVRQASTIIRYANPRVRSFPPLSSNDTMVYQRDKIHSHHVQDHIFEHHDILHVFQRHSGFGQVAAGKQGKAVIQQQATRGCVQACAAMLLYDHGKTIDWQKLRLMNGRTIKSCLTDFERAQCPAKTTHFDTFGFGKIASANTLKRLSSLIQQLGSAIIAITPDGISSHAVILDELSAEAALIRDPYHGWQIQIRTPALQRVFEGGIVVQVQK